MLETLESIPNKMYIIYDGDCPFCSAYVRLIRIRESVGEVSLIDARQCSDDLLTTLQVEDLNLDEGMAVRIGDRLYFGAEAIHVLALLSTGSGIFNRVTSFVFQSPTVSRILYPLLRFGRNMTLRILGRSKIDSGEPFSDK